MVIEINYKLESLVFVKIGWGKEGVSDNLANLHTCIKVHESWPSPIG